MRHRFRLLLCAALTAALLFVPMRQGPAVFPGADGAIALADAVVSERLAATAALWSGQTWGIVQVVPRVARHGDQIHMHGMVGGGPAAEPWWSCSQYSGWFPNGTSRISLFVPGDWEMPYTGIDIFDQKVNVMDKDGGPKQAPKHVKRLGVHVADALGALTVDVVKDEVLCLPADVARNP
ncbi:MAG: hypothetical protein IT293_14520 [Deltaproteobacteria bacterium]|nr:hypothetical protein [Deltaproteobacteria bacterium]